MTTISTWPWVRYPCTRCNEEVESASWPETKEPLCYRCTKAKEMRDDSNHLADLLEDEGLSNAEQAMVRLLLNLGSEVKQLTAQLKNAQGSAE